MTGYKAGLYIPSIVAVGVFVWLGVLVVQYTVEAYSGTPPAGDPTAPGLVPDRPPTKRQIPRTLRNRGRARDAHRVPPRTRR